MKKYAFLVLAGILVGCLSTIGIIASKKLPSNIARYVSYIPEPSPIPSPSPVASPSPHPTENSLKVGAFALARLNDIQKKELKLRYSADDKTDTEFLTIWALDMDADPALYAKNEAIMKKIMISEEKDVDDAEPAKF